MPPCPSAFDGKFILFAYQGPLGKTHFRDMGQILRLIPWLLIPLVVVGLPGGLLHFAAGDEPLVVGSGGVSSADRRLVEAFWKRYDPTLMQGGRRVSVWASAEELDVAIASALASEGTARGRAAIEGGNLVITASGSLPRPLDIFGPFVNARVTIAPSRDGLYIPAFRVGRLNLPPPLARSAFQAAIEALVGGGRGEALLAGIQSVSIKDRTVTLAYVGPMGAAPRVETTRPPGPRKFDPHRVRIYYQKLAELSRRRDSAARTSLTTVLQPLFRLAARQSERHDPVGENSAAIAALALYFGAEIESIDAAWVAGEDQQAEARPLTNVRLDGRREFVRRFISAAAHRAAGNEGLIGSSIPADTDAGFSFTDVAVERAGRRFAATATASKEAASRVQRILSGTIGERDMCPPVLDLPEGLTESEFKQRYGDRQSAAFKQVLAEIDRRIERIPLYR